MAHEEDQAKLKSAIMMQEDDKAKPASSEGGWGFVIVGGVFVMYFLILGYFQIQTFFYVEWQLEFDTSASETSVLVSMSSFTLGISSPISSILASIFGNRIVVMTGGSIAFLAMIVTMLLESTVGIILSWGVVIGFGFALTFAPSIVMIGQYFDEHFTVANGVAFSGGSVGQICMPLITSVLIDSYGWRGAILILSAITCHFLVSGAVIQQKVADTSAMEGNESINTSEYQQDHANQAFEHTEIDTEMQISPNERSSENEHPTSTKQTTELGISGGNDISINGESRVSSDNATKELQPPESSKSPSENKSADSIKRDAQALEQTTNNSESSVSSSRAPSCSIYQIDVPYNKRRRDSRYQRYDDTEEVVESVEIASSAGTSVGPDANASPSRKISWLKDATFEYGVEADTNNLTAARRRVRRMTLEYISAATLPSHHHHSQWEKTLASLKALYRNISFDLMLAIFFIYGVLFFAPVTHAIPRALEAGISESKAALLPTMFGIGNLLGKVVPTFIADFLHVSRGMIAASAFAVCSVANFLNPFFTAYWHHALYHVIYGSASGTQAVFIFTIIQVILPSDHRILGVGFGTLIDATGYGIGALCVGWIVDATGSYQAGFWFCSGLAALGTILMVLVTVINRRNKNTDDVI